MNPDLLSIGEAGLDVFMVPLDTEALCEIDTKKCLIAFPYGEKVPVKNLEFSMGQNAANNAVGAQRLGIKTAIVLTIGQDSTADIILSKLKTEGVDTTFVVQQPSTTSNFSSIINYQGERTIFSYHAPRSYEFPVKLPTPQWVYLTSMGESFRPFYNHIAEWLESNPSIKLAFNPGTWQIRAGKEALENILKRTHLIYVNREEAEKLTSFPDDSTGKEKELLEALEKLGPKFCVITDGGNGVFASNGQTFLKCNVLPVDAYERTGAGDAFGSGCLSAIIKGKTLDEALIWGTVNSSSVIGYTGSQKGLLREVDIPIWLERANSSGVKVVQF